MDCPETVGKLTEILRQGGYLADRGLSTAVFVALSLQPVSYTHLKERRAGGGGCCCLRLWRGGGEAPGRGRVLEPHVAALHEQLITAPRIRQENRDCVTSVETGQQVSRLR